MINPLARVVMQNVVKDSNSSNRTNKITTNKVENVKSLDELAKGIKGEVVEVEKKTEETISNDTKLAKTMSFSDIAKKAKGEPVESTEYKASTKSKRVNNTQSLSDLARNIKGGEVKNTYNEVSTKKETKNMKFNDLLKGKNKSNNSSNDNRVEGYIDSKDRSLISNVINGNKKATETDVKSAKLLNLSQAVSNIINR